MPNNIFFEKAKGASIVSRHNLFIYLSLLP